MEERNRQRIIYLFHAQVQIRRISEIVVPHRDESGHQWVPGSHWKPCEAMVGGQFPWSKVCFQQDGAPSHTAVRTQTWLRENLRGKFWGSKLWPPSSPDLNPLDYGIWGAVESKACRTPHPSVEALKTAVDTEWETMSEEFVRKVWSRFRQGWRPASMQREAISF